MKERYYVTYHDDGSVARLAKIDDVTAYGWENGKWVEMPGLISIEWDATRDYYEITKDQADGLIEGGEV